MFEPGTIAVTVKIVCVWQNIKEVKKRKRRTIPTTHWSKKKLHIRVKNESANKNLMDVERKVAKIKKINLQRTNVWEKNENLIIKGRSSNLQSKTILKSNFSTPKDHQKKDKIKFNVSEENYSKFDVYFNEKPSKHFKKWPK